MKTTLRRAVLAFAVLAVQAAAPASYPDTPDAITPDAITPDGGRYYGPLADGRMQGRGRIEWPNGTRYEGEFRQGLYWGQGELKATALVDEWERKDVARESMTGGKPAKDGEESRSLPQIHSPAPIEAHLQRWWAQLAPGYR